MARTALAITTLTTEASNAYVNSTAGTAIDATNSHSISPPEGCAVEDLLVVLYHTTSSTKTATVKAGANPPALRAGAGDLVVSLTAGDSTPTQAIVPLGGGSRFMQADGTISIDIAASMTGRIAVFRLPRNS